MPKLLGLVIALLAVVYILLFSPLTKIKTLEIIGGNNCIPPKVSVEEFNLKDRNLLTFSKSDLQKIILSGYPCVDKVSINKIFPAKVRIEVRPRSAILRIEGTNFSLTQDGLLMDTPDASKLPILYYPVKNLNLRTGEKFPDQIINYVLKLTIELSKSDFTPASVRIIDQDNIAVYNTANLIAVFSSKKPPNGQVDSLQLVLSKAKIDAAKIDKIDLRFDQPVVESRK